MAETEPFECVYERKGSRVSHFPEEIWPTAAINNCPNTVKIITGGGGTRQFTAAPDKVLDGMAAPLIDEEK
jgi:hypothetical protein